jgi:signal transduction histidine kinase
MNLRNKVTAFFLLVAITGIIVTVFVTTRLFVIDKGEYVSALNQLAAPNAAESISKHLGYLETQFIIIEDIIKSVNKTPASKKLLQSAFIKLAGVQELVFFDKKGLVAKLGKSEFETAISEKERASLPPGRTLYRKDKAILLSVKHKNKHFVASLDPAVIRTYLVSFYSISTMLLDRSGTILVASSDENRPLQSFLSSQLVTSLNFSEKHALIAKQVDTPNGAILVAAAPVPETLGVTVVVQSPDTKISQMVQDITKNTYPYVAGILILVTFLGFVFSNRLVKPIEKLTAATSEIASGHWNVSLHTTEKNEIGRLVGAFNKMGSELEKREQDLEKAHQDLLAQEKLASLGKFSAGIAHEVKNPLNSILGFAQLIQQKNQKNQLTDEDRSTITKFNGFIMDETRRAAKIITDLLTFARQKPPTLNSGNLGELINYTKEMFEPQAIQAKVTLRSVIELDANSEKFLAEFDRDQMYQVLSNLTGNAIHALEEKPEGDRNLTLSLASEKGFAMIQVKDTGSGISEVNLARIFEPFFTTKKVGEGTGLGLALCHGIILQHRGTISVESMVGSGTTFTIRLPQRT